MDIHLFQDMGRVIQNLPARRWEGPVERAKETGPFGPEEGFDKMVLFAWYGCIIRHSVKNVNRKIDFFKI